MIAKTFRLASTAWSIVPDGLEDRVEGPGEVRPAVTDQEPEVPEPLAEIYGQVPGPQYCPLAGRVGGDAAEVHPAGVMLDEHQHV